MLSNVGAVTEVAYVYGGGSGPIKDGLYSALLAKVEEMNSSYAFPVLYLDSTYSRHLNHEGLFIAAEVVEARSKKGTSTAAGGAFDQGGDRGLG